ncbi:hypothetical protein Taro_036825, partial [Colocasia esculenta]|nr:hypothetical protein [Colocasia esculenta]
MPFPLLAQNTKPSSATPKDFPGSRQKSMPAVGSRAALGGAEDKAKNQSEGVGGPPLWATAAQCKLASGGTVLSV